MYKKILIVNVNWLGDVLFSTVAIRALRERFPNAYIASMVVPRVVEVLKNNPYLDELIIFDERSSHRSILKKIKFVKELKKKNFDTAILFHRSFTRALICYLAGIKKRIGYFAKKRNFLLTESMQCDNRNSLHRVDYFLSLLKLIGINRVEDKTYDFVVPEEDNKFVDKLLKEKDVRELSFKIIAHTAANWDLKRWPKQNFAELLDKLSRELKAEIFLTGSKQDKKVVDGVIGLMNEKAHYLCGRTNFSQLAALMKRSDLVVSADSGPMHLAAAVGAKNIFALFGPTSAAITGPKAKKGLKIFTKDTGCSKPCYVLNCQDNRCMKEITAEEVFQEILKIHAQKKS